MKKLHEVKSGKVVGFGYDGGNHPPYTGKVVDHRDLLRHPLSEDTIRKNPNLARSQFLTTVAMPYGKNDVIQRNPTHKQFYHDRTFTIAKVGLLSRLVRWMRGVRYGYTS